MLAQPSDDEGGFGHPHALDAAVPEPADPVDVIDELGEREQLGAFDVGGQIRVQPRRDRVARQGCLRDQPLEPAQRFELPGNQSSATGQAPGGAAVLAFVGLDLFTL